MSDFNNGIVAEFRDNNGQVGGMFEGKPLLLLHTTGAKTGADRVTPLMYQQQGDRFFVFASYAGAPSHPAWYRNIESSSAISVEIGDGTKTATALEITGTERDEIYSQQESDFPQFAEYQDDLDRVIPVIEIIFDD